MLNRGIVSPLNRVVEPVVTMLPSATITPPAYPHREPEISGPAYGDAVVIFAVLPSQGFTFKAIDDVRRRLGGEGAIGHIYDVSPPASAQGIIDELSMDSSQRGDGSGRNLVVSDHHGGAAPLKEALGAELTASECLARDLPRLFTSGALDMCSDGSPQSIVAVTHSMNLDPDKFVCDILFRTYLDPELRSRWWQPERLGILIEAARFGDVQFFGGLAIDTLSYESTPAPHRIALAAFQLINEAKEGLVSRVLFDEAVLAYNIRTLIALQDGPLVQDVNNPDDRFHTAVTEMTQRGISTPEQLAVHLREQLGAQYRTPEEVLLELRAASHVENPTEDIAAPYSNQNLEGWQRALNSFTLDNLSRAQIREAFIGKREADVFGAASSTAYNVRQIALLSAQIRDSLMAAIEQPETLERLATRFISDLKRVHELAAAKTSIVQDPRNPTRRISVTIADQRLDYDSSLPESEQPLKVWDWLREASAAFADPRIHIMVRPGGGLVVSSRAARDHDELFTVAIDLAQPSVVSKLLELEQMRAEQLGQHPAKFLIKSNLWLPLAPAHVTLDDLTNLLFSEYESIVAPPTSFRTVPLMPEVSVDGTKMPFDGLAPFLLGRDSSQRKN